MKVRDVFFEEVYKRVKIGEDIVIVSSDIGAPSLDDFREYYPDRFINVGIAEQNSIAVAAGLSLAGKKVITYGLNPFPVTRAFDQIRNIANGMRIPITIAALNAGSCSAEAGYSHCAIENMSLMRTLKNIQLLNLSDETMAKRIVSSILDDPKPRYIQFDKYIDGIRYEEELIDFDKGFIESGNIGADSIVVSYGIYVKEIMEMNLPCKIIDCFCIPVDVDEFCNSINKAKRIITVEDSIDIGGIGSMVLEILNDRSMNIPVKRISMKFGQGYPTNYYDRKMLWNCEDIDLSSVKKIIMQTIG